MSSDVQARTKAEPGDSTASGHTLARELAEFARRGDRPAVIAFGEAGPQTLSFAELEDRAMRIAGGLADRGIATGEPVALFAPNSAAWITVRYGLIAAGAVAVHMDETWQGERIAHALRVAQCRRAFTVRALAAALRESAPWPVEIFLLDADGDTSEGMPWTALLARRASAPAAVSPDDDAALFFTSGTTGAPKPVPLTHCNILTNVDALLGADLVRRGDRLLLPLPLYHSYPFVVGCVLPLAAGIAVVLPSGVSGPELAHALKEGEATVIIGVPRLFRALHDGIVERVRARGGAAAMVFGALLAISIALRRAFGVRIGRTLFGGLHRQFAPRLRLLASGGARLDADVAWRLEGLGWEVLTGYGLVETASIATFERSGRSRPGSAGQPSPATRLRISPAEGWPEGIGEVQIGGPLVFRGYGGDAAATRAAFTGDGWFRTGDVGRIDGDGFLHIVGRLKEMIVTQGGKNISPEEVEAVYAQSPYIREFAVLEDGDDLVGLVVPDLDAVRVAGGGRVEDLVRVAIGERSLALPTHERIVRFAMTRERLPRTALGKYQRFALPAIYARAERGEPPPEAPLGDADRRLLDDPTARQVFDWLKARFPDRPITPDTSPQLDLGIDSLAWVSLGLELEQRFGVRLSEQAISRAVTVRDLLNESIRSTGPAQPKILDRRAKRRERIMAQAAAWVRRRGPILMALGCLLYAINRAAMRLYFRLRVEGAERVPESGPLLIAPNHASDLDPFVIAAALPPSCLRHVAWAGDVEQVFLMPLARLIARPIGMFPIDHRMPGSSLSHAAEVLRRGGILVMFPEGFRSPTGELQPFQRGIGRLVAETGASVVPAHISGSFEAMRRGTRFPRPVRVSARFGAPIAAAELAKGEVGDRAEDRIVKSLEDALAALSRG